MRRVAHFSLIATIGLGVNCGTAETPTSPTTTEVVTARVVVFSGTLSVGGSRFYSFTASQAGTATLTLASLARGTNGPAVPATVGLGLGIPSGADCAMTSSVTTGAMLTAQITGDLQPGIYCARIADVGRLTEAVSFAIRIVFP
jgi:hypothetical protein